MRRPIHLLIAVTLVVVCVVGASLFVLLLQISATVRHVDQEVAASLGQLNEAIGQAQRTAALTGKLVNDGRLAMDNINRAAIDQRRYFEHELPSLMDDAQGLVRNMRQASAELQPLLAEATGRTRELEPIEASSADLVASLATTARDPRITASLTNLEASTAQLATASAATATTMQHVEGIAADGQEAVHKLTHPRPIVSIMNWSLKIVRAFGAWL